MSLALDVAPYGILISWRKRTVVVSNCQFLQSSLGAVEPHI